MSDNIFMNQAIRNMKPMFIETNSLELVGLLSAFLVIISGISTDPFLLLISLSTTIIIFIYLAIESLIPNIEFHYDMHGASFRRMIAIGWAFWRYPIGRKIGPQNFTFFNLELPILKILEFSFLGFILIWFASRYYDQITDGTISELQAPFLLVRGIMRGAILTGLLFSIFSRNPIPEFLQFPYLFGIYILEPIFYTFYQATNRTYSTYELTLGNSRLPIIALRETLLSNLFLLWGTMAFNGVEGDEWQLLRVLHIFGLIIVIVQSFNSINRFNKNPLGNDPLGRFMKDTPEILQNLNLKEKFGHVINNEMEIKLAKTSSILLGKGSIIVPIEETKDKINALILGNATNIVEVNGQRVAEAIEGISSVLISKKEFVPISKELIATKLSEIDFNNIGLPSIEKFESLVYQLSNHLEGWVGAIINQLTKIDLSNYGISERDGHTMVNLPGITVNETPDLTTVKVGNIRVWDADDSSTVRIGSWLNVVDLPQASFVSLPGITVLDLDRHGTAVSILGFKISDGIPADTLDQFRRYMLERLDSWESSLDSQLGRILADKKATGVFSLSLNGDFKPLLEGKRKTIGDHVGLLDAPKSPNTQYLPSNFGEELESKSKKDIGFIELTGSPRSKSSTLKPAKKAESSTKPKTSEKIRISKEREISSSQNEIDELKSKIEKEISGIKEELNKEKSKNKEYDFDIIDVELIEEDDDAG